MSLFPAYVEENDAQRKNDKTTEDNNNWLENSSYISLEQVQLSKNSENDSDSEENISNFVKNHHKNNRAKKHHKSVKVVSEFTGDEAYYVDKKPCKGYLKVSTLHKPACPRYTHSHTTIGYHEFNRYKKTKRYYSNKNSRNKLASSVEYQTETMAEEEFGQKMKEINELLRQNPKNIDIWINYVQIQDKAPIKCTKTQLAEKKLNVIEKALIHNIGDKKLYMLYIDIINSTYPSFEVSKYLEQLISKDPTNYFLWNAQILATQGSMARCIVPDVLRLYEECMQKIYRKLQQDEILLKLFSNCALFLRQSGRSEQFFALIKLALELNVSVDKFTKIHPSQKDQQVLMEYEEIILKSGLPMNEIWLRIERLRQNFNFLPCPINTINCSDPQRIIFNEDICFFIYPLNHKENSFQLIIIILKLLKIPIVTCSTLQDNFLFKSETYNDYDAIEEILSIFLYPTDNLNNSNEFNSSFYDVIKDFASSPSYILSNIGSEIYYDTIVNILLLCAECFENDNRKNQIFILIWLRFEKIMVILKRLAGKLLPDDSKKLKTKVKNIFKKNENRNVINLYTEYALIEYEFGNLNNAENIFTNAISDGGSIDSQILNSDFCHAYVCYAEIMIQEKNYEKALKILTCYALGIQLNNIDILTESRKLSAFVKLTERLNDLIRIEKNVQIMELDQYFLPDFITSLLKAKIYYEYLLNDKIKAIGYIETTLKQFVGKSERILFIREKIYEIYLKLLQLPNESCFISNLLIFETSVRALKEFPNNFFVQRICASLEAQPWYKLRGLLTYSCSPIFVIFLIVSARYRYIKYESNEETYKTRIINLLKSCLEKTSMLKKNSLLWRIYLQNICDTKDSFEKSKNILFAALDECPWIKELYLTGAICVPQELSQLQDLLIEKQLRLYALPDELEILRNDESIV